jgi:hypothetical protein
MFRNLVSIVIFICVVLAALFVLAYASRGLGIFGFKLW